MQLSATIGTPLVMAVSSSMRHLRARRSQTRQHKTTYFEQVMERHHHGPRAAENLLGQKEEQSVRVLDVVHDHPQVAQVIRVCVHAEIVVSQ